VGQTDGAGGAHLLEAVPGPVAHNLAFYCTTGGSNTKKTLKELAAFTGKQPLALLSLRRSAVRSGDYRVALMEFADRIRSS